MFQPTSDSFWHVRSRMSLIDTSCSVVSLFVILNSACLIFSVAGGNVPGHVLEFYFQLFV